MAAVEQPGWRLCINRSNVAGKFFSWPLARENVLARAASRPATVIPSRYNQVVLPRIAIPVPHSTDREYAERSLPQYEHAIKEAGGEPVRIPLDQTPAQVMKLIEHCDAVLLPGSKADVDPAKYDAPRDPQTNPADAGRDMVDELLLQDAYNMRKPVLGICYGLQILNVYRSGTLTQHVESPVNHAAGRKVSVAHSIEVMPPSKLATILRPNSESMGKAAAERRKNASKDGTRGFDAAQISSSRGTTAKTQDRRDGRGAALDPAGKF